MLANGSLINVEKDEVLLTDNMHRGFVELCNDGETSLLRIFYLKDGEGRLEWECTQISDLERAEDCSSLVFRICRLKSGIDCNEHVLIKPERSKDCHTIYYAFRYLQQKSIDCYCVPLPKLFKSLFPILGDGKSAIQQKSAVQKRTLVKQLSTFHQISVKNQAYVDSNQKKNKKAVPLHVKNGSQKRKPITSTDIYLDSPNKRLAHKPPKDTTGTLAGPFAVHHPDELLKEDRMLAINSVITKGNNPKKEITNLDDAFLCTHNRNSAPNFSARFQRLSAGTDGASLKGFLNLGNSCYMNAVLQGLFHVEAFKDLLNVVPESSECSILSALKALQKNYEKAASAMKRCLLENVFKFLGDERLEMTEQEDAQEFLTIILEKINFELESLSNNKNAEENSLSESVMSLSSIFGFELKHEITCNRNSVSPSLQMLLENCLRSEVVEHICPRCNEKFATMSHEFRSLSKCLIIFLKRYDFKQSASKRGQRKLKDAISLSMCIHLVSCNRKQSELKNCFNSLLPISDIVNDDQVSFVLETPPNELVLSSSSSSDNIIEDARQAAQEDALKTIQEIDGFDDEKFSKKIKHSTKSSVIAYDSTTNESLDYLTLFCLPRLDFCERSCAELNIRCHFSTVRQEPKPLFCKSIPSSTAPIVADGNCLFRSIALYLSGSDEEHSVVRKNVVEFEEKYDDELREVNNFSLADWKEHIRKMTNDGEWATEIELLALAALLDADIWTFLNGKWLRYRPLYTVGKDGISHKLPIQKYDDNGKDAIFLINENFHYKPVFDIISNGTVRDYHLAAVISHKGIGPSNGHYVCDVKNLNRNIWMHFDDSHVEERTEAEVIAECAEDGYIFFYVAEN
ncbi:unnamed protein product [Litomosoides sigmodontis]|uniref:Ubiquitin carboxyl-terminal hydrolase n=1 Tax=Litomosoides sigmodontis TaxID=42156 RepID=A0A3P6S0G3_LITSI|nr:unnamed protein product [Litomosoides sigmodontis]